MKIDAAPEGGKFRATAASAMDGQVGTWGKADMLCVDLDSSGELITSELGTGMGVIWVPEGRTDGTVTNPANEVMGGRKYTVFRFVELVEAEGSTPALTAGDNLYAGADGIVDITPAVGDVFVGTVLKGGSSVIVFFGSQVAITVAGVAAQGTLTIAEPITTTDDFTIGTTVYQMITTPVAAYDVAIGANEAASKVNIVAAINASGTEGVEYFAGTLIHPDVTAIAFAGDDCVITANVNGTAGNSIATTETFTHASNIYDAATLGTTTAGVDQVPAV